MKSYAHSPALHKPGVMVHAYDLGTQEVGAGGSGVQSHPQQQRVCRQPGLMYKFIAIPLGSHFNLKQFRTAPHPPQSCSLASQRALDPKKAKDTLASQQQLPQQPHDSGQCPPQRH